MFGGGKKQAKSSGGARSKNNDFANMVCMVIM